MNKIHALVTGASRGIGLAISNRLEADGCFVLRPSRKELDLSSNGSIDSFINSLKEPVDILVNNAGINNLGSCLEITDEQINEMIQINLQSPLRLIRKLVPGMIKRKAGKILNISSIWGQITKARRLTYSMTKSGLDGMTRTLAVELAQYNILVNSLAPGYVNTELTKKNNSTDEIKKISSTIPMGRLAEPTEIAEAAAFLVSEKNTYITGQVIIVDGGFICL